jgi:hypothetical protein
MRCANLPCTLQWTWSLVHSFPGLVQWCHPICFVCCKSPDNLSLRFSQRSSPCSCGFLYRSVLIHLLCRNTQQYHSRMAVVPGYQTELFNRVLVFLCNCHWKCYVIGVLLSFSLPESEWNDLTTGSLFTSQAYNPESLNLTFLIDKTHTSPPVNRKKLNTENEQNTMYIVYIIKYT